MVHSTSTRSRDSRVLVSSDFGLYEYKPPSGLNVKLVKSGQQSVADMSATLEKRVTAKRTHMRPSHTVYLKPDPDEIDIMEEERIDELYDTESNYDESTNESEKQMDRDKSLLSTSGNSTSTAGSNKIGDRSEVMQIIKPVRTNKVRLGRTAPSKSKTGIAMTTVTATKEKVNASKENISTTSAQQRSPKVRTNAKGEPKQPKKCEICGNEYMYQHALER